MTKKEILIILAVVMLLGVCPVKADLVFDHGYNTFNSSYPGEVWVINDAILDVLGGEIGKLETTNFATANLYGGDIDWLWTDDGSVVNIHRGDINWLAPYDNSTVNLYSYDVIYHPQAPYPGHPVYGSSEWIEGIYFSNDVPFSFGLASRDAYSHINIVPEPTAFFLLGIGSLWILKKK